MQDRVSLYPGRVKLVPVSGQENTYDMVRADEPTQEGTPLNKASLLTDATAAMFGLGPDAVPDEVLGFLGKYNKHCWKKTKNALKYSYESLSSESTVSVSSPKKIYNGVYGEENKTISLVETGGFTDTTVLTEDIIGKFISSSNGVQSAVYLITDFLSAGKGLATLKARQFSTLTLIGSDIGEEYLYSSDRNAYPDSGYDGIYKYEYSGVPFNNLSGPHSKIAVGSYAGIGKYGPDVPCVLNFDFAPKLVCIFGYSNSSHTLVSQLTNKNGVFLLPELLSTEYKMGYGFCTDIENNSTACYAKRSEDGKTIFWYVSISSNPGYHQFNQANTTYHYFAFG